jgi:hypothetical protein
MKPSKKPEAQPVIKTYRLVRTSLTERQIVEFDIQDGVVIATKEHEPDLGRIVLGKFFTILSQGE